MDPDEITVIIYQARGLQSKRKGKCKFNAVFGQGGSKFKTDIVQEPDGNPEWNTESEFKIEDISEPLIIKIKEKDTILGQVVVPVQELPKNKPNRQKRTALQPHKKCPEPTGELIYEAWVSKLKEHQPTIKGSPNPPDRRSSLARIKGALSHSPMLGGRKHPGLDSPDSRRMSLQVQSSNMQGFHGSSESIASTVSAASMYEDGQKVKKKSAFKKFKGAFSHSPKLGKKSLKNSSSQSMHDLTAFNPSGGLSVQNIDISGSKESLNSQVSQTSITSDKVKEKSSTMGKLKARMSPLLGRKDNKKNGLGKKGSQSCHDLTALNQMSLGWKHEEKGSQDSLNRALNGSNPAPSPLFSHKEPMVENVSPIHKANTLPPPKPSRNQGPQDNISVHSHNSLQEEIFITNSPSPSVRSRNSLRSESPASTHKDISSTGYNSIGSLHENPTESEISKFSIAPPLEEEEEEFAPDMVPEITGISPKEGPIGGGTKIIIRGRNLGGDKSDILSLSVCGCELLDNVEYQSSRKLFCVTKPWKVSKGKVVIKTKMGGRSESLVEFAFVEPPRQESPKSLFHEETEETARNMRNTLLIGIPEEKRSPKVENKIQKTENKSPVKSQQIHPKTPEKPPRQPENVRKPENTVNTKQVSQPEKKNVAPQAMKQGKVETEDKKRIVTIEDRNVEGQERQPTVIEQHAPHKERTGLFSKLVGDRKKAPPKEEEEGPTKEELLQIIKTLQEDNKALKEQNEGMKGYIDTLLAKVIESCPDALCSDSGLFSRSSPEGAE